jgi:hypothetical protein
MLKVSLTHLPILNSIVIKQTGGHLFIAAQDSIIIDKEGLLELIKQIGITGFITWQELELIGDDIYENTKDSSSTS